MRVWAGASLVLGALLLGTTFAHVLEIRAKARMDGALWVTLQQHLYRAFASVGGGVEIGAIAATAGLAWTVRGRPGSGLATGAAACFALAFVPVWVGIVLPVNREVFRWQSGAAPPGWERRRRRWDLGHATRFGLHLLGFGMLAAWVVWFGR
jgi:hypothetical protein